MDGFATCQKIRESSQVPIIMLTGEGRDEEKIRGLEMGADDYITKPFSVNELTARVKAVLRRSDLSRPKTITAPSGLSEAAVPALEELTTEEKSSKPEETPEEPSGQDQDQTNGENYEGAVKLIVQTTGAIKDMLDFVDALREHPQFHLLRMVSNAQRDGMDVWLRLREPGPEIHHRQHGQKYGGLAKHTGPDPTYR
jgi:response regulator RpfG family c-di-GMP phosphodiesterase